MKLQNSYRIIKILFLSYDTIMQLNDYSFYFLFDKVNLLKELNRFDKAFEWLFLINSILNQLR